MCNRSPFHLGAVRKEYGFPYLELSKHALKKSIKSEVSHQSQAIKFLFI